MFNDEENEVGNAIDNTTENKVNEVVPESKKEAILDPVKIDLGKSLKETRKRLKLNQKALADVFKVTTASICFYENGKISNKKVEVIKNWIEQNKPVD